MPISVFSWQATLVLYSWASPGVGQLCSTITGPPWLPLGICGLNCYLKSGPQHRAGACKVSDEERADMSYTLSRGRGQNWLFKNSWPSNNKTVFTESHASKRLGCANITSATFPAEVWGSDKGTPAGVSAMKSSRHKGKVACSRPGREQPEGQIWVQTTNICWAHRNQSVRQTH